VQLFLCGLLCLNIPAAAAAQNMATMMTMMMMMMTMLLLAWLVFASCLQFL